MITLIQGDITSLQVDAIVNAANSMLAGGGGVDGAIHRAAGPSVLEECRDWIRKHHRLNAGIAMITNAGKLHCKKIIHTVGPIWEKEKVKEKEYTLGQAYQNSLKLAVENGLHSIAFPNISTGVYGFPKQSAAEVAIRTVRDFMNTHKEIHEVIFCCFDEENYSIYQQLL